MNPEEIRPETRMPAALEQAISEIRGENIPQADVDAAASRVWERLTAEAEPPAERIRDCAAFQELFADYRAGRLNEARTLLVRDHLHECVACRRVFEGRVVPVRVGQAFSPANSRVGQALSPANLRPRAVPRWAIAAGVVAAGGLAAWFTIFQHASSGRAIVQSINGTLYEVSAAGLRPMAPGEALPDGVEIRTARDSRATIALGDGSLAELHERSDFSASGAAAPGADITLHLDRGSLIVQAARRRSGHLFVATADCRVAVTGTMFGVNAGVKGTRVSVVEGQVSVSQENRQNILRPGEQLSTSEILEPAPVRQEVAWSRNARLLGALETIRESPAQAHLKQVRYSSRLLPLLPASTVFYAAIPNLSDYLAEAKATFRQRSAEDAGLRAWLAGPEGAQAAAVEPFLDKLRAANEYLGDEIVVFGTTAAPVPVILAEVKRDGFAEFLRGAGLPLTMEMRSGLVLLSPNPKALAVPLDSTFQKTEFYRRIEQAYRKGAGLLLCADLQHMPHAPLQPLPDGRGTSGTHLLLPDGRGSEALGAVPPARYLIVEQEQVSKRMETRAVLDFAGPRQGMAAWLAAPSPFGALDYVTPEATLAAAFVVADPAAVLDQILSRDPQAAENRQELAASLGGEFAVALDGPPFPVPSWKLVAEVYDPARFQRALEKLVVEHNRSAPTTGAKLLRTAQETVDRRTYYLLGLGDPNPLGEAHYTFASGYLIAAPTRALVERALEIGANGMGLARSQAFTALLPHDPYSDFSAVMYQNLGTTFAPFAALLGPKGAELVNQKPRLIAAYAEPDRVTLASTGDILGISLNNLLSGSALSAARDMLPLAQLLGTSAAPIPSR